MKAFFDFYMINIIDARKSFVKFVSFFEVFLLSGVDENNSLASLNEDHSSGFANSAFESGLLEIIPQGDFLSGLGLLSEDGFGLSSVTGLFGIITSST
jgi:hypothetical protein